MARDIEEFLRKAAERRAAQQKGQRPASPPVSGQSAPPASARPSPGRPSVGGGSAVPELEEEPDPFPTGQTVSEHVQKHIDSGPSEIARQTRQLGERVGRAGKKVQERVQQKFDHEVGQLAESQAKPVQQKAVEPIQRPAASAYSPGTIAALMRSPQSLRQAIIVSELLKRPEWD